MCLVLTDSGVAECPMIDREQLDALAGWLCAEHAYHDRVANSDMSEIEFDTQVEEHGHCDICRDFAGEILARFTLTERTDR